MSFNKVLVLALSFVLLFSLSALSQDLDQEEAFEFADYEETLEEFGIPNVELVEEYKNEALSLYEDGNYEEAEEALENWGDSANQLANIISQGLEPFYGATRSDRDDFSYSRVQTLVDYEDKANELKAERNEAYYKRAESLRQIGQEEEAFALYQEVLNIVSIDEWDLWVNAASALYEMVGVEPIE